MRITIGVAAMAASLCLLAGCNRGGANNSASAPAPNAAEPAASGLPPVSSPARDNEVRECVSDLSRRTATGADLGALCGCAVDRVAAGTPQADAVTQCAAEQHVTLTGGESGGNDAAAEDNATE